MSITLEQLSAKMRQGEQVPLRQTAQIVLPKELEDGESFPVRRHQIDTNEHVNNCQYIQMAIDVVPECERAGQIRVEYKKSAVMGDIIYPKMAVEEQRKIVELCDAEGNPYAVVEFKEK